MKIDVLTLTSLETNCYLVSGSDSAVVIDPGAYSSETADFLRCNSDCERLIILTHAHFDHIGGAAQLREETGVEIAVGEKDVAALSDENMNLSSRFSIPFKSFSADRFLRDGEQLEVGKLNFKIIETPGHTPGSICLFSEDVLFSGDLLFSRSVGRTDFPGGNTAAMLDSLKNKISILPETVRVFPGHGSATSIGAEKKYNPYLGRGGEYEFM